MKLAKDSRPIPPWFDLPLLEQMVAESLPGKLIPYECRVRGKGRRTAVTCSFQKNYAADHPFCTISFGVIYGGLPFRIYALNAIADLRELISADPLAYIDSRGD